MEIHKNSIAFDYRDCCDYCESRKSSRDSQRFC